MSCGGGGDAESVILKFNQDVLRTGRPPHLPGKVTGITASPESFMDVSLRRQRRDETQGTDCTQLSLSAVHQ